jgi:hypothetical protein
MDWELIGDLDEGGECTLKNFWIGESLKEYFGDSIDLTGDLDRALMLSYELVLSWLLSTSMALFEFVSSAALLSSMYLS